MARVALFFENKEKHALRYLQAGVWRFCLPGVLYCITRTYLVFGIVFLCFAVYYRGG